MSMTAVKSVDPRSPAHRAGIRVGETLTHINGHMIVDVLDYKFYSYDPRLEVTLRERDGSTRTLRIRKGEGEDLGLEFETYLMDRARSCANNCIFCFVDQMPPGMRPSLYFKDDDARLSFLMGNYLTLTNLSPREVQRIIDLRISPINVSVHHRPGAPGGDAEEPAGGGEHRYHGAVCPKPHHHELPDRILPRHQRRPRSG